MHNINNQNTKIIFIQLIKKTTKRLKLLVVLLTIFSSLSFLEIGFANQIKDSKNSQQQDKQISKKKIVKTDKNNNGTKNLKKHQNSKIKIGNNVWFNNNAFLCSANYIEVGDFTLVGQYVTIMDHEAHEIDPNKRRQIGKIGEVIIGKNVWIGNNVIILKNTIIGDNSIVAAGSIVSGYFDSNIIIGGVPAKKIKNREDE